MVECFSLEGHHLKVLQRGKTTLVAIPTLQGGQVLLRHNPQEVTPISAVERAAFNRDGVEQSVKILKAPFVKIEASHDLKMNLSDLLPQTLKGNFTTDLTAAAPISISSYRQKVTFEMSDTGVEASAATIMIACEECCGLREEYPGLEIILNSPFSFVLEVNETPLFNGMVVDLGNAHG